MKYLLPILTFLVVFMAVFGSGVSIKCQVCAAPDGSCEKKSGGPVRTCNKTHIACSTTYENTKGFHFVQRACLDGVGVKSCMEIKLPKKCHMCEYDECNTEDVL